MTDEQLEEHLAQVAILAFTDVRNDPKSLAVFYVPGADALVISVEGRGNRTSPPNTFEPRAARVAADAHAIVAADGSALTIALQDPVHAVKDPFRRGLLDGAFGPHVFGEALLLVDKIPKWLADQSADSVAAGRSKSAVDTDIDGVPGPSYFAGVSDSYLEDRTTVWQRFADDLMMQSVNERTELVVPLLIREARIRAFER